MIKIDIDNTGFTWGLDYGNEISILCMIENHSICPECKCNCHFQGITSKNPPKERSAQ